MGTWLAYLRWYLQRHGGVGPDGQGCWPPLQQQKASVGGSECSNSQGARTGTVGRVTRLKKTKGLQLKQPEVLTV